MPDTKVALTGEGGGLYLPVTDAGCVRMPGGGTLADREPVHPLVTITHDLDAYPYPMLLHLHEGAAAVLIPAGITYAGRGELTIYTAQTSEQWGGAPQLHKIRSREYTVSFDGNAADTVYIRLI